MQESSVISIISEVKCCVVRVLSRDRPERHFSASAESDAEAHAGSLKKTQSFNCFLLKLLQIKIGTPAFFYANALVINRFYQFYPSEESV